MVWDLRSGLEGVLVLWIELLCSVQWSALKYKAVKLFAALGGGSVLGIEHYQLNTENCTAELSAVLVEISFLERRF